MITKNLETLRYWITEREAIREAKEAGYPPPWTDDPILKEYRFCNVHREDDKVTRYLRKQWYPQRDPHCTWTLVRGALLARLVNWPPTLDLLPFPNEDKWDDREFCYTIKGLMDSGKKVWTGAYMITADYTGAAKYVSVAQTVEAMSKDLMPSSHELQPLWVALQKLPRVGSFIAAQVIADVKYYPPYLGNQAGTGARDWMTFCAPGPGSMAGLNWLYGTPNAVWKIKDFQDAVNALRDQVRDLIIVDAQDMQNCLCEVFKYQRGHSRSRYVYA